MKLNSRWGGRSSAAAGLVAASLIAASLVASCATAVDTIPFTTSALGDPKHGSAQSASAVAQPSARIALIVPQAGFGPSAVTAKGMKQAAELALFERNNPNIQLITKDEGTTPASAKAAAAEAINEGAEIILGPLFATSATAVAEVARSHNIPVLAFSNDAKAAQKGVYLMSFLAEQETRRIVAYAASQGKRRFAAFIPDTPYGAVVEPVFRAAVAAGGGSIVALERYGAEPNQMLEPSRRVFAAVKGDADHPLGADALFLPGGADLMVHVGPLLTYAGIDTAKTKLIGTGSWEYATIGRDQVFLGAWYPAPDVAALTAFSQGFAKTFGAAPPRLATLSYDAMNTAMALASEPKGERYTESRLTRAGGFMGVDGVVRFSSSGLPDRDLVIHQVQAFGTTVLAPATGIANVSNANAPAPAPVSAGPAGWIQSMASSASAAFTGQH